MNAILAALALLCGQAAPAPPPADPIPEPPASDVRDAVRQIQEAFKADYALRSPDDRKALARKLLQVGSDDTEAPAMQFALLTEAVGVAVEAGDAATVTAAIDAMGARFRVDTLDLREDALKDLARSVRTPEAAIELVDACLLAVDEAILRDRFSEARSLITRAESAARKTRDAGVATQVKEKKDLARSIEAAYRPVKSAVKTLESDPADADANLAVGRYFCLVKGDWKTGTFLLLQGSDAVLRGLAEREIAAPGDPAARLALGDGWWDVSEKERKKEAKRGAQARAVHWYEQVLGTITGLDRIRVDKRIEDYYSVGGVTRYVYLDKKSMALHPKGRPFGIFPAAESDDATDIFRGKPIYYNQTTGREAYYEIQLTYPVRQVYWKGAAMSNLAFEVQDRRGTVLATGGPFTGGNVWGEGTFNTPPLTRFILKVTNNASNWLMLTRIEFRRTPQ